MNKDFESMKNAELEEYCKVRNIHVDAKNVSKPTKAELLFAISEFNASQKKEPAIEDEILSEIEEQEKEAKIISKKADDFLDEDDIALSMKANKKAEKVKNKRARKLELISMKRVIINSNAKTQTMHPNQVHFVTWGNRNGHYTDRFILGKPWIIRTGAIENLKRQTARVPIQNENGETIRFETKPAWLIQELPQPTEEELAIIAKRQTIRENSIENLV